MKIRDLCAAIGCGIDYDATTGQVILIPQETTTDNTAPVSADQAA